MLELSEAAKAAQREYMREYRRKNPEAEKERKRRYWERKAAAIAREREGAKNAEAR